MACPVLRPRAWGALPTVPISKLSLLQAQVGQRHTLPTPPPHPHAKQRSGSTGCRKVYVRSAYLQLQLLPHAPKATPLAGAERVRTVCCSQWRERRGILF